jgi:RNA polymerase sigma-70 factor (ECF subfamily)
MSNKNKNKLNKESLFNKIVKENHERIERICGYYNSNAEIRKDAYQEVLINIWNSLDNFRGDSAISTWVYRVAVNTSISFSNKSIKQSKIYIDLDTQNLSSIIDEENLRAKLKEEKQLEKLHHELNQLTIIDSALISLQLEGLSIKEIAEIIGITEANVKVKIHRIKTLLKTKLNSEDQ